MVQGEPVTKGRVLYVGGFEMPDRNAAAHRVLNNAKIFRALGLQTVFCGVDRDIKNAPEKVCGFENIPQSYPETPKEWFWQLADISSYRDIIEKYDDIKLVMCYNLHALPLIKLMRFCKRRGIKIAADCTEWYENKPSLHPVKMIKCIDTALAMRVQKKLDGIIAISSYLEKYYKPFVPVVLRLPPLVDVTDDKWTEPVPAPTGRAKLVYSGSCGDAKDKLEQMVKAAADIDTDFEFTLIGIDKEQFLQIFSGMQDCLERLDGKIYFKGRVSHSDSIKALKSSDYCIFVRDPTRKNTAGFPTKFVESYTSGVGIIANDISDIREYFPKDGISVLADKNDDISICGAICSALEKDIAKVRENRRDGVTSNPFDITANIQRVKDFLTGLGI